MSPHRLTPSEIHAIQEMVTSPDYRHVPTRTLAVLAQRLGTVCASRVVLTNTLRSPRPGLDSCGGTDGGGAAAACTSSSMIEAWWRSLKHHWLFLHALDSAATVRRLVAFLRRRAQPRAAVARRLAGYSEAAEVIG